jgi:hypothetical protein
MPYTIAALQEGSTAGRGHIDLMVGVLRENVFGNEPVTSGGDGNQDA